MKIKTRFAPSPTGYLHIGSVRTALYAWLFARHNNGKFLLRIEDSDVSRSTNEAIKAIINGMNWLNLKWDEGPYFQTKRFDRYNSVINTMLTDGTAYKCYCSKERLDSVREKQIANNEKPRYDGYCRYNRNKHSVDEPFVVRFANPKDGSVIFNDQIRGQIKFNNQELDDLIIRRIDNSPTYNFCVVIDDWDMEITHVIRGEEHINNTPRQINIQKALNAPVPTYAHVSMIIGKDGKKLSKRHGATNVMQYRDDGYLPEALLNYLVRLGWSSGNQEIFSCEEMIKLFSFKAVRKSSCMFDVNKLMWLNHQYINTMSPLHVASYLQWQMDQAKINTHDGPEITQIVKLLRKRCKTLKEIAENCRYFYEEFEFFNTNAANAYLCTGAYQILKTAHDKLAAVDDWTLKNVRLAIEKTANERKVQINEIGMSLRVAVTGSDRSPALDVTVHMIGKRRSLLRINKALNFIRKQTKCN